MTDDSRDGPGPIALVGSGEYLPVMVDIERGLIRDRGTRYVQLATAAAPEGRASLDRWHALGLAQAQRLGVDQVVVDVRTREDADREDLAGLIDGAALIYLSGGNPAFLAETLRETRVWHAIESAYRQGSALAGCSAGAMALSSWAPRMRDLVGDAAPTLGLLPHLRVIPHFDRMGKWMPDMMRNALLRIPKGVTLIGIDERTALVGGPYDWVVQGDQSVWGLGPGARVEHPPGTRLHLPPLT